MIQHRAELDNEFVSHSSQLDAQQCELQATAASTLEGWIIKNLIAALTSVCLNHSGKVSMAEFNDILPTAGVVVFLEIVYSRCAALRSSWTCCSARGPRALVRRGRRPAVDIDMLVDGCVNMQVFALSVELQGLAVSNACRRRDSA